MKVKIQKYLTRQTYMILNKNLNNYKIKMNIITNNICLTIFKFLNNLNNKVTHLAIIKMTILIKKILEITLSSR